jgi:hypothetical protein
MTDTSDFRFSPTALDRLIDRLAKMAKEEEVSKEQWSLLVSIFAAAPSSVEVEARGNERRGKFSGVKTEGVITDPKDKEVTVEDLRKQLRKAYMPAKEPGAPLGDHIVPPNS